MAHEPEVARERDMKSCDSKSAGAIGPSTSALSEGEIIAAAFDYGLLDQGAADLARNIAHKVGCDLRRVAGSIIEIGRDLLAVKKRLGHGSFSAWIAAEFDVHERTAQRFMQTAEAFGDAFKYRRPYCCGSPR